MASHSVIICEKGPQLYNACIVTTQEYELCHPGSPLPCQLYKKLVNHVQDN